MKKTFRELIVHLFALSYLVKIGKTKFTFLRAANMIAPSFMLVGIAIIKNPNYPEPDLFTIISLILCFTMVFFGFVYFRIYPVERYELDIEQKFFYDEYKKIFEGKNHHNNYANYVDTFEYYNIVPFLSNIVFLILTLIIIYYV